MRQFLEMQVDVTRAGIWALTVVWFSLGYVVHLRQKPWWTVLALSAACEIAYLVGERLAR